ncbi:MAG: hypothetical protein R6V05_14755 [Candidatus Brocadiia bacterium]
MDAREAKAEWDELSGLYLAKNYTRAKFADEIQNRLEVVMLRVVQGLACAREHDLLSPAQMAQAQEALLDIAHAAEQLGGLAAMLYGEIDGLKGRMEMLERQFDSEPESGRCGSDSR